MGVISTKARQKLEEKHTRSGRNIHNFISRLTITAIEALGNTINVCYNYNQRNIVIFYLTEIPQRDKDIVSRFLFPLRRSEVWHGELLCASGVTDIEIKIQEDSKTIFVSFLNVATGFEGRYVAKLEHNYNRGAFLISTPIEWKYKNYPTETSNVGALMGYITVNDGRVLLLVTFMCIISSLCLLLSF